jgi:hypothetical protein
MDIRDPEVQVGDCKLKLEAAAILLDVMADIFVSFGPELAAKSANELFPRFVKKTKDKALINAAVDIITERMNAAKEEAANA